MMAEIKTQPISNAESNAASSTVSNTMPAAAQPETAQPETESSKTLAHPKIGQRFRGFLPVVVDVETAGFDAKKDALLEIACQPILLDSQNRFVPGELIQSHLAPFAGANFNKESLIFNGIDPFNPMRMAIAEEEKVAFKRLFKQLNDVRRQQECRHCILVGHNAHFDLGFLKAAIERSHSKNQNPFHSFSVLDTVTLSAMAFGQTVLARACQAAGIEFSGSEAHSAAYDTQKTAELFCHILNAYPMLALATGGESSSAEDG